MNDDPLEQRLRDLPDPALPADWRATILATARREAANAAPDRSRENWPALLLVLRRLFARNPITAGVLTALWLFILLLKAGTPVDPSDKELLARIDPNRPIYFVFLKDQIRLAQLAQDEPDQKQIP